MRTLFVTVFTFATPSLAWGQDAPGADADRDNAVAVTARRHAENIRDVPISVQAISGETLKRKGTIDLQSLVDQTSGLNSTGGNPATSRSRSAASLRSDRR